MKEASDSDSLPDIDFEIGKLSEYQIEYQQANIGQKISILEETEKKIFDIKEQINSLVDYFSQRIDPLFKNIANNIIKPILVECESLMVNENGIEINTNSNQTNEENKKKIKDIYKNIKKILEYEIFTNFLTEETKTTINTKMQQIATYCGENNVPQQNVLQQNNQENPNDFEIINDDEVNNVPQQGEIGKIKLKKFDGEVTDRANELLQRLKNGKTIRWNSCKDKFLSAYYRNGYVKDGKAVGPGDDLYNYIKTNDALTVMFNGRVLLIKTNGNIENDVKNSGIWEFFAENLNDPGMIRYTNDVETDKKDFIIRDNLDINNENPLRVEIFVPGTDHHMSQINAQFTTTYIKNHTEHEGDAGQCSHSIEKNTIYFFPSNIYKGNLSKYATVDDIKDRMDRAGTAISAVIKKIMSGKESKDNIKICCRGYSYGNFASVEALKNLIYNVTWIDKVDNIILENPGPQTLPKSQTNKDIKNTIQKITEKVKVNNVCVTYKKDKKLDLLHYQSNAEDLAKQLIEINGIEHLFQKINNNEEDFTVKLNLNHYKNQYSFIGNYTCKQSKEPIIIDINGVTDVIFLKQGEKITSKNLAYNNVHYRLISMGDKVEFEIKMEDNETKKYRYIEHDNKIYKYSLEPMKEDQNYIEDKYIYDALYKSVFDCEKCEFKLKTISVFNRELQHSEIQMLPNMVNIPLLKEDFYNDNFSIKFLEENNINYKNKHNFFLTVKKIKDLTFFNKERNQNFFEKHFFKHFKKVNNIDENRNIDEFETCVVINNEMCAFTDKVLIDTYSFACLNEIANYRGICISRYGKQIVVTLNCTILFTEKGSDHRNITIDTKPIEDIENKKNLNFKNLAQKEKQSLTDIFSDRMTINEKKDFNKLMDEQVKQYIKNLFLEGFEEYIFFNKKNFLTENLALATNENKKENIIASAYTNAAGSELIGWKFNDEKNIFLIGAFHTIKPYRLLDGKIYKFYDDDKKIFDIYEKCRSDADGQIANGDLILGQDCEITLFDKKQLKLKKNDKVVVDNPEFSSQLQKENDYIAYIEEQFRTRNQNQNQNQQQGGMRDPTSDLDPKFYQWSDFRKVKDTKGTTVNIFRNEKRILSVTYKQDGNITYKKVNNDNEADINENAVEQYMNEIQNDNNEPEVRDENNINRDENENNINNVPQEEEQNHARQENNQLQNRNNNINIHHDELGRAYIAEEYIVDVNNSNNDSGNDDNQNNFENIRQALMREKPEIQLNKSFSRKKNKANNENLNNINNDNLNNTFKIEDKIEDNIKETFASRDLKKCFKTDQTIKCLFVDKVSCPIDKFIKAARQNITELVDKILQEDAVLVCFKGRVIFVDKSNINELYELFSGEKIETNNNKKKNILSKFFKENEDQRLNIEVLINEPEDELGHLGPPLDVNDEGYSKQKAQFSSFIANKIIPRCEQLKQPNGRLHSGTVSEHEYDDNTMYIMPMISVAYDGHNIYTKDNVRVYNNNVNSWNHINNSTNHTIEILKNILQSKDKSKKNIKLCFNGFGLFSNFQCAHILNKLSLTANQKININSVNLDKITHGKKRAEYKPILFWTSEYINAAAKQQVNIKLLSLNQEANMVDRSKKVFFLFNKTESAPEEADNELYGKVKDIKEIQQIVRIQDVNGQKNILNENHDKFYKQNIVSHNVFANGELKVDGPDILIYFVFNEKEEALFSVSQDSSITCQSWINDPKTAHMSNENGRNYINFEIKKQRAMAPLTEYYKIEKRNDDIYMYCLTAEGEENKKNYSFSKKKYDKKKCMFDVVMSLTTTDSTLNPDIDTLERINYGVLASKYLSDNTDVFNFIQEKIPNFNPKKITSATIKVKNSDLYEENNSLFKIIQEQNNNDEENICRIEYQGIDETFMASCNFFLKDFSCTDYVKLYRIEEDRLDDQIQISVQTPEDVSCNITALKEVKGNFDLLKLIDDNSDIIKTVETYDETSVFQNYISQQLIQHNFTKENDTNLLRYIKSKMNFKKEVNSENDDDENTYTLAYVYLATQEKEFNTNNAGFFGYYFQKDDNAMWVGYIERNHAQLEKEGIVFKFHDDDRKTYDIYRNAIAIKGKLTKGELQLGKDSDVTVYNADDETDIKVKFKTGYSIIIETLDNKDNQWYNYNQINNQNFKKITITNDDNTKIAEIKRDVNKEVTYVLYDNDIGDKQVNFSQFKKFIEDGLLPTEENKQEELINEQQIKIQELQEKLNQETNDIIDNNNDDDKKEEKSKIEEHTQDEDNFINEEQLDRNQNRQERPKMRQKKIRIFKKLDKKTIENKTQDSDGKTIENEKTKRHINVNEKFDGLEQDTDTPEQQTDNIDDKKEVNVPEKPVFNVCLFILLLILTVIGAVIYGQSYANKLNKYKEKYQKKQKRIKNETINNQRNQLYF